jgi:hypothetical protein
MACREGFISVPKQGAPERFSIQTGLICNLFGAQHPLCKWVDEFLPELPFADVGKDIAKRIRSKLKDKINTKLLREFDSSMLQLNVLNEFLNQINTVNQLIDDIWDTLQGGEVSTLEFCLAGKPELPDSINWGDVFLAFTRIYPNSLLEKLSQIIAFEKYFELCECRRKLYAINPDDIETENDILSPIPPAIFPPTPCGERFENYYNANQLPTIQALNSQFNVVQNVIKWCVEQIWSANYSQYIQIPFSQVQWEIIPCPDDFQTEFRDIKLNLETIKLAPSTNYLTECCELEVQYWKRFFKCGKLDIKFTIFNNGEVTTFYDVGGSVPLPCLGDENYLIYEQVFFTPIRLTDKCEVETPLYPEDYDFRIIEPINPVDPCDSEYAENYGDLCNCPPSCQEQETIVRIIKNCNTVFEPRSLYLP